MAATCASIFKLDSSAITTTTNNNNESMSPPAVPSAEIMSLADQSPVRPLSTRAPNIVWDAGFISRDERIRLSGQRGLTIWFTGLSASGKSTLAGALEQFLLRKAIRAYRLDGDNIRFGLNKDLAFSPKDRCENIRRIAEVAKLFADASLIALTSFISPYAADRDEARRIHNAAGIPFIEIYVDVPIEVAERRDPKGLYRKARVGQIKNFTGIDDPYEPPVHPEIHIRNDNLPVEEGVQIIYSYLVQHKLI